MQQGSPYKGSGQLTREQFLFYEMRITAKLVTEGLQDEDIIKRIVDENLFQYPTEKSVRQMARTCIKRLHALEDKELVTAIAINPSDEAKQICMYAMMKQYRIIWDFMMSVIGEKYRIQDFTFGKIDVNIFFNRLQEQDDYVAGWSVSTVNKIRQVIIRVLVENDYLDNTKSNRLNPVYLYSTLENAIRMHHDERALPAFNCFS